jgi:hypothetical protein
MRAEDLIALAAPRGIDLKHIAGMSTPTRGVSVRQRHRTSVEITDGIDVRITVRGSSTRTLRPPVWSVSELGQAARNVPRIPWLAARFAVAGDNSSWWELHTALVSEARKLRRQHEWPAQLTGLDGQPRFYLEDLAQLVLDEERHAPLFAAAPATAKAPSLYAVYLRIEEELWSRRVFERFDLLKLRYLGWRDSALAMIQQKLSQRSESDEQQTQRA